MRGKNGAEKRPRQTPPPPATNFPCRKGLFDACPHAPRQIHGLVNEGRCPITLYARGLSPQLDVRHPMQ